MVLVFDIGNTNITIGAYVNDCLQFSHRLQTKAKGFDYSNNIHNFISSHNIDCKSITNIVIGSVVKHATDDLKKALFQFFKADILDISTNLNLGFNINIPNPEIVGADLIAGCSKAVASFDLPCLIFDIGTATTATLLDENKNLKSCFIFPGPKLSFKALFDNCDLLPDIDLGESVDVMNDNTEDSIRAGIVFSQASAIDGIATRVEQALNKRCTILVTGGLSPIIIQKCFSDVIYQENLILDGFYTIFKLNSK